MMDEVHREIQSPARFVHSAIVYLDDTRMVEARKGDVLLKPLPPVVS